MVATHTVRYVQQAGKDTHAVKCIQVEDGHCPATGWPLSRNWMATIQQLDGHCPGTGYGHYPGTG